MLIKVFPKLVVVIGPLLILGYMLFIYFDGESEAMQAISWSYDAKDHDESVASRPLDAELLSDEVLQSNDDAPPTGSTDTEISPPSTQEPLPPPAFPIPDPSDSTPDPTRYHELFSISTSSKKYFPITFSPLHAAINPSILPHRTLPSTYILIAQLINPSPASSPIFSQISCNAVFQPDGSLSCTAPPTVLPVAPTTSDKCKDEVEHFTLNIGPHDMRVFYTPTSATPLAVYGSQSQYTCFGMWAQDFGTLVPSDFEAEAQPLFSQATELQRPAPWQAVEKNWFLFWDTAGEAYIHHSISPSRVFAKLDADGTVSPDLAPLSATLDAACLQKWTPKLSSAGEALHQATNSLAITMCKRGEEACVPGEENTFAMTIIQHKIFPPAAWHGTYNAYVLLFRQSAPFALYAVSRKPLWIHGRGGASPGPSLENGGARAQEGGGGEGAEGGEEGEREMEEMLYVSSLSWKAAGQRYHGYIDDELFLSFGIEDQGAGGIDVLAGDLLQELGMCEGGS